MLATKPDDPSRIPGIYLMGRTGLYKLFLMAVRVVHVHTNNFLKLTSVHSKVDAPTEGNSLTVLTLTDE